MSTPRSPSKHIPLSRLMEIQADHGLGRTGVEYQEGELEQAIAARFNSLVESGFNRAKQGLRAPDVPQGPADTVNAYLESMGIKVRRYRKRSEFWSRKHARARVCL